MIYPVQFALKSPSEVVNILRGNQLITEEEGAAITQSAVTGAMIIHFDMEGLKEINQKRYTLLLLLLLMLVM